MRNHVYESEATQNRRHRLTVRILVPCLLSLAAWISPLRSLHAQRVVLPDSTRLTAIVAGRLIDGVDGSVRGDPLADIDLLENVDFVMKDGVVYKQGGQNPRQPATR